MNRSRSKLHRASQLFQTIAELDLNRLQRSLYLAPAPHTYSLAVTFRCNSRCAACGIWNSPPGPEIAKEHYAVFFQDKLVRKARVIGFTGGELTLRSDLIDIMQSAYDSCPKALLTMNTNCIRDDKLIEMAETFKNRRLSMTVSLDGLGNLHDQIRGVKGNFDKVMAVINHMKDLEHQGFGVTVGATITVSMMNVNAVPDLTNNLRERGVPFQLDPWVANEYYGVDKANRDIMDFTTADARKEACDLFAMYDNPAYKSFIKYWQGEDYPKAPCYTLTRGVVWVRPNGDIPVCLKYYKQYVLGNITAEPFDGVWRGKRAKELRRTLHDCVACAIDHPNMCDALNNYTFHGWAYRDRILQYSHSKAPRALAKAFLR